MPNQKPKNILIAPLDWGGGHTTRCMPLIDYLIKKGHNPIVAGNDAQLAMISEAFGGSVATIYLEGYNITYSPLNRIAQAGLLLQMPRVAGMIKQEHQWLQRIVKEHSIDGVISDNRYGLYHSSVPSVIMTHQLRILSGLGAVADNIVQRIHYRYLNRFGATWIVDAEGMDAIAGRLSHPSSLPRNARYIGLLSRFADDGYDYSGDENGVLLVLLSGPEPQRSILSRILWQQVQTSQGKVIFAEGSDNAVAPADIPAHITYYKRLGGAALRLALKAASMVVCRSGYSTIMDLMITGKKAILIPTPGQTEQEYLGKQLHDTGTFYSSRQQGFKLHEAINMSQTFPYHKRVNADSWLQYRKVAGKWLTEG